jgi:two-component system response regulator LytT
MNILIFEDEYHTGILVKRFAEQYAPDIHVLSILESIESGTEWYRSASTMPDLILMDIQLADGNSFELFDKVKIDTPVVFITAYDEFAVRAFNVNVIDYLLKPIDFDSFKKALDKYFHFKNNLFQPESNASIELLPKDRLQYKQRFLIKQGTHYRFVLAIDVYYFQSDNGLLFGYLQDGSKVLIDGTLEEVYKTIDPDLFFRINRKTILSIESIAKIESYFNRRLVVKLKNTSEAIVVSRDRVQDFKTWLNR